MSSYISTYNLEQNTKILTNIYNFGLRTSEDLAKNHQVSVLSNQVGVNLPFIFVSTGCKESVDALIDSMQTDSRISNVHQIAFERHTDTTRPNLTFNCSFTEQQKLVEERVHNCVMFALDINKIDDRDRLGLQRRISQQASQEGQNWERKSLTPTDVLVHHVPRNAFEKAFVPCHLVPLFKRIFPDTAYVEIPSKQNSYMFGVKEIPHGRELGITTSGLEISCLMPDFFKSMRAYIQESSKMFVFHAVRLYSPSDERLINAERDADFVAAQMENYPYISIPEGMGIQDPDFRLDNLLYKYPQFRDAFISSRS